MRLLHAPHHEETTSLTGFTRLESRSSEKHTLRRSFIYTTLPVLPSLSQLRPFILFSSRLLADAMPGLTHQAHPLTVPELAIGTYLVHAHVVARLYHAPFAKEDWVSTGLTGLLLLGRDHKLRGAGESEWWFRLVDEEGSKRKTVWIFKIPSFGTTFEYRVDKPFFHIFGGASRRYGFLFTGQDDNAAGEFAIAVKESVCLPKVTRLPRSSTDSKASALTAFKLTGAMDFHLPRSIRSRLANFSRTSSVRSGALPQHKLNTKISSPQQDSFVHVAHVGMGPADDSDNSAESELEDGGRGSAWMIVGRGSAESARLPQALLVEQHQMAEKYLRPELVASQSWPAGKVSEGQPKTHRIRRKPSPRLSFSESPAT
ncbi:CRIB domain-containing protein [Mycena indigotica]|uniref:CRIB domain-containing protein n=1 Tax=Mycena indigotica TaxID=2126181 RepID=A0A8H6VUU5_9AGAR|nr:CRIB domain-containing protein [Mycena indigotica]KAF7292786.1 CRIB domain-containing protein [Mycena indigotica]